MISELILSYFLFRIIEQVFAIKRSLHFLNNSSLQKGITKKKIFIFIPVFKEEKIINETINYFSNIQSKQIRLVFITTQKEGSINNNQTYLILKKLNQKILHYPYVKGDKASQLNYAIKQMTALSSKDYVVVFDADSRPDLNMFEFVLQDLESPPLYQAFSNYFDNFNSLNGLAKANAIYQTRWTFSFEISNMIKNYYFKKNKVMYLIGHGFFIRKDIYDANPIPESTLAEDIVYGYKLNLKKIIPKPLPFFDNCTVPNSLKITIKQSGRWFAGELNLFKLVDLKNNFFNSLDRLLYFLQWIFGPPVLLLIILTSLFDGNFLVFFSTITLVLIYDMLLHYFLIRSEHLKINLFWIFIKNVTDCFGPFYSLYYLIVKKIGKKEIEFYKTPR